MYHNTPPLSINQMLQQAIAQHQAGNLMGAEHLYRSILLVQQDHPDANHNLGLVAIQKNQPSSGLPHFKAAIDINPHQEQYWLSYIGALLQTSQITSARQVLEAGLQKGFLCATTAQTIANRIDNFATNQPDALEVQSLIEIFSRGHYSNAKIIAENMTLRYPKYGYGWKVLGAVLKETGRNREALQAMQKAVEASPLDAETHNNTGIIFRIIGLHEEAEASYRRALQVEPDNQDVLNNLGNILLDLGRSTEAEACYMRALQIKPDFAEAHSNLGSCLRNAGKTAEAEACYIKALQFKPNYQDAINNLALLYNAQGNALAALNAIRQSLAINETVKTKSIFVDCIRHTRFTHADNEVRQILIRALLENWGSPRDLIKPCIDFIKLSSSIKEYVAQKTTIDLKMSEPYFSAFATDRLLCTLLRLTPVCDTEMESFLTIARNTMLEIAISNHVTNTNISLSLDFCCALASQCFINEYVFAHTEDEIQKAHNLKGLLVAELKAKTQVPALWLVVVAAYFPLYSVPFGRRLLEAEWADTILAVLRQQILEPEEEQLLRSKIQRLTSIDDGVSLLVQNQYEENPYPRWIQAAPPGESQNIVGYLRQIAPLAHIKPYRHYSQIDILIAGCGTGKHSIETAQSFQDGQVLAIDLSMSSLCYAARKTKEIGLTTIEYAQADILKLGTLNRSFDVIESVGVLHHLVDPIHGWQVLLSLLRPGGFMKLGFYSEIARRNIVRIRDFIAKRGYEATDHGIRQCRQDLIALDNALDFGNTTTSHDFYSTSTCRDLLFHVQERPMSLTCIEDFLREEKLTFLGFTIDQYTLHAYKKRFPDDLAATNLGQWHIFENENPDTFSGMYQFWIQKYL